MANGKNLPEVPTLMFEFIGTGNVNYYVIGCSVLCSYGLWWHFEFIWINFRMNGVRWTRSSNVAMAFEHLLYAITNCLYAHISWVFFFKKIHFPHGTRYCLGNFQNTIFNRKPCYCQDNFQNTISDRKLERFQSRLWRMCVYQNHLISCGKIDLITIHVQFCYMISLVMCVLFRTKPV